MSTRLFQRNKAGEPVDQRARMLETPVSRLIPVLAVPTIISMLVTSFYNMADTFFVGMLDDIKVLCLAAEKLKKELDQYIGLLSSKNRAEFQEALDVVLSECDWQNG